MDNKLIQVIQSRQYNMLCEVKRICDYYNINYFLCCGTLLGTIRHKGPIPWDDDLDIGFLREEYKKFLNVAPKELKKNFFLQTWITDENFALPHGKLRDMSSHYIETANKKSGCIDGISIDLLPFDALPQNRFMQIMHGRYLFHIMNIIKVKRKWVFIKEDHVNFIYKIIYMIVSKFHDDIYFIRKYDIFCQKYNTSTNKMVSEAAGLDIFRFIEEKKKYEDLIPAKYCDLLFKIPREYDAILRKTYGDYNRFPQESMQRGQPGVEKVEVW